MAFAGPIRTAVLIFPFLVGLLTLPFLIWQYRHHNKISPWHTLMIVSFSFYMMTAYFLVLLPFPSQATLAHLTAMHAPTYNLDVLAIFKDFFTYNPLFSNTLSLSTLKAALKDPTTLQPLFNIFLTVPFGMYLRYYFKLSFKVILLLSLALTLSFETIQFSALFGYYSRPYRLFDVDDLFLNTLGGVLGYWFAPLMRLAIPQRDVIDARFAAQRVQVTVVRRMTSFVVDLFIIGLLSDFISWLSPVIIFVVLPIFWHGQTIGSRLLHMRLDGATTKWRYAYRAVLSVGVPWTLLAIVGSLLDKLYLANNEEWSLRFGAILVVTFVFGLFLIDVLIEVFRPGHALWFERISGVRLTINDK